MVIIWDVIEEKDQPLIELKHYHRINIIWCQLCLSDSVKEDKSSIQSCDKLKP